jgi:hypothetical protein
MICINCPLFDGFVLLDMAGPITAFETASQCGIPGDSIEVFGSMVKAISWCCILGNDWFHISMRIRHLEQIVKGMRVVTETEKTTRNVLLPWRVNQTMGGQFTPLGAHLASLQLQKSWPTRQVSEPRILR